MPMVLKNEGDEMVCVVWDLMAHEYLGPFLSYKGAKRWADEHVTAYAIEYQSITYPNSYNAAEGWRFV